MLAVGPAVSSLPKRRRWESNPLEAALQAAAVPSGSSAKSSSVLARSRTWSSTFAGSRANPPHSENMFLSSAPPRNRTSSGSFDDCHARPAHPQGFVQVSRPGLEPGSGPSEGPMRSLAPSRRFQQHPDLESNQVQGFRKASCDPLHHRDRIPEPTTGFAPASSGLQNRRLSHSSHVGNQAGVRGVEPRWAALETASSPRRTPLYSAPGLAAGSLA